MCLPVTGGSGKHSPLFQGQFPLIFQHEAAELAYRTVFVWPIKKKKKKKRSAKSYACLDSNLPCTISFSDTKGKFQKI